MNHFFPVRKATAREAHLFNLLPEELLEHIFEFTYSSLADICTLELCCKEFYRTLNSEYLTKNARVIHLARDEHFTFATSKEFGKRFATGKDIKTSVKQIIGCNFNVVSFEKSFLSYKNHMASLGRTKRAVPKIVVNGTLGSGKSSFVLRFIQNSFFDGYDPSLSICFRTSVSAHGNKNHEEIEFDVHDTIGMFIGVKTS